MRINIKGYWRSIPIVLYMLVCMLPALARNIGTGPLALVVLLLLASGVNRRIIVADRNLFIYFFLCIFYFIFEYLRVRNITAVGNLYENILFLIPLLYYTLSDLDKKNRHLLVIAFFAIQTYIAFANIVLLINNPYLSKYMTGGVGYVVSGYQNTNLGSISSVFLSTLIPIFSVMLLNKIRSSNVRFVLIMVLLVNLFYVILARSFLCVAILIIGIVLFVNKDEKHRGVVFAFTIIFSFLVLMIFSDTIRELLSNANLSSEYKNRIIDILDWITGTNQISNLGFIRGRASDYITSISTFIMHPLLGVGMIYSVDVSIVGMHSEIFDFLARYGLIGALLFISLLRRYFTIKQTNRSLDSRHMLLIIILYMVLNPCISRTSGIVLFWVIPMLITRSTEERESNDLNYIK